jgi:Domain of Unknown Function (DUF1080)
LPDLEELTLTQISRAPVNFGLLVSVICALTACSDDMVDGGSVSTAGRSAVAQAGTTSAAGSGAPSVTTGGTASAGGASTAGASTAGVVGSGTAGSAGAAVAGGSSGGSGGAASGGVGSGGSAVGGGSPIQGVCPNCQPIFDGKTLDGWVQLPASSWSVVDGAMHSLAPARGVIYTSKTYADFRFIFTSRLVKDPTNHLPCVLFWGNALAKDALSAIQIQPPNGYMWDYRATGPTANKSPDQFEKRLSHPAFVVAEWNQCEMLGNKATGGLRFACCAATGTTPCKASEVVQFTDPSAGKEAPLAVQVHNAGMIEEFKDLYVESPVADPNTLVTTK